MVNVSVQCVLNVVVVVIVVNAVIVVKWSKYHIEVGRSCCVQYIVA